MSGRDPFGADLRSMDPNYAARSLILLTREAWGFFLKRVSPMCKSIHKKEQQNE
jgi:hypothetical protein